MGAATPCAGCGHLRRQCGPGCVFAPYFPPGDAERFAAVDAVFGSGNIVKLLSEVVPEQRAACVQKVVDQAVAWQEAPAFGGIPHVAILRCVLQQAKGHDAVTEIVARRTRASAWSPTLSSFERCSSGTGTTRPPRASSTSDTWLCSRQIRPRMMVSNPAPLALATLCSFDL